PVLVVTQGEQSFRRVWLEFLRMFQSIFSWVGARGVNTLKVDVRLCARKPRPGKGKVWIKLDRALEVFDAFQCQMNRLTNACLERQAAQICIVSLRIICRFSCQRLLLVASELRLQCFRDAFGDLAFDAKDVS